MVSVFELVVRHLAFDDPAGVGAWAAQAGGAPWIISAVTQGYGREYRLRGKNRVACGGSAGGPH